MGAKNSFEESFSLEDLEEIGIELGGAKLAPTETKEEKSEEVKAAEEKLKAMPDKPNTTVDLPHEPKTVDEVLEQDFPSKQIKQENKNGEEKGQRAEQHAETEIKVKKRKLTLPKSGGQVSEPADAPRSDAGTEGVGMPAGAVKLSLAGKLQALRYEINRLGLKMHGKGSGSFSFDYFELADFLPQATELMHKLGLATAFNMSETVASLTLLDTESDKELLFTVPVSTVNVLARGSAAQNIGAAMTFARRYLYLALLDLSEVDTAVDAEVPAVNTGGKTMKETPRADLEVKQPKGVPVFNLDDL